MSIRACSLVVPSKLQTVHELLLTAVFLPGALISFENIFIYPHSQSQRAAGIRKITYPKSHIGTCSEDDCDSSFHQGRIHRSRYQVSIVGADDQVGAQDQPELTVRVAFHVYPCVFFSLGGDFATIAAGLLIEPVQPEDFVVDVEFVEENVAPQVFQNGRVVVREGDFIIVTRVVLQQGRGGQSRQTAARAELHYVTIRSIVTAPDARIFS
mmetsp:Transcript_39264/g.83837  ORF Transcript_39264/g.83837 Transcript_39264/m.83837 type:complete len:211 (-) Transcript_39264:308-940(-)